SNTASHVARGVTSMIGLRSSFVFNQSQSAIKHRYHIDAVTDSLTCRGSRAVFQKIPASNLRWIQVQFLRDRVHVPFNGKQTLRRTEAPKRAVRWVIRRNGFRS